MLVLENTSANSHATAHLIVNRARLIAIDQRPYCLLPDRLVVAPEEPCGSAIVGSTDKARSSADRHPEMEANRLLYRHLLRRPAQTTNSALHAPAPPSPQALLRVEAMGDDSVSLGFVNLQSTTLVRAALSQDHEFDFIGGNM